MQSPGLGSNVQSAGIISTCSSSAMEVHMLLQHTTHAHQMQCKGNAQPDSNDDISCMHCCYLSADRRGESFGHHPRRNQLANFSQGTTTWF